MYLRKVLECHATPRSSCVNGPWKPSRVGAATTAKRANGPSKSSSLYPAVLKYTAFPHFSPFICVHLSRIDSKWPELLHLKLNLTYLLSLLNKCSWFIVHDSSVVSLHNLSLKLNFHPTLFQLNSRFNLEICHFTDALWMPFHVVFNFLKLCTGEWGFMQNCCWNVKNLYLF